jgi:hypothetical protein
MASPAKLREHLLQAEGPVFAVLDGAQFEDLPTGLYDGGFVHKPLYRFSAADRARARTAPQFVWLDRDQAAASRLDKPTVEGKADAAVLDRLLDLIAERAGAVFWQCPAGGDALYRHLRTINKILFPRDAEIDHGKTYEADPLKAAGDNADAALGAEDTHEWVVFRHADANVMVQVLPALDSVQFARLFGPADTLLFTPDEEWGGGAKLVHRPNELPNPPSGPLRLHTQTVKRIEDRRLLASRARRARYLRDTCKAETRGTTDEAVAEHIRVSEETGKQLGLVSEAAHCRWAFIMCKTNGRILQSREALGYIAHGGDSPDDQVKRFMLGIADGLKRRSHGGLRP